MKTTGSCAFSFLYAWLSLSQTCLSYLLKEDPMQARITIDPQKGRNNTKRRKKNQVLSSVGSFSKTEKEGECSWLVQKRCLFVETVKDEHVPLGPKYPKEATSPLGLSWSSARSCFFFLFTSPLLARIFRLLLHLTEKISNRSADIWSENRDISCDLQRRSRHQFSVYRLGYSVWTEGGPAGIVIHIIARLCALL